MNRSDRELVRTRMGPLSLYKRVVALEKEIQETRRLNQRLSDVLDVITEVLVPAVDRDDERMRDALSRLEAVVRPGKARVRQRRTGRPANLRGRSRTTPTASPACSVAITATVPLTCADEARGGFRTASVGHRHQDDANVHNLWTNLWSQTRRSNDAHDSERCEA